MLPRLLPPLPLFTADADVMLARKRNIGKISAVWKKGIDRGRRRRYNDGEIPPGRKSGRRKMTYGEVIMKKISNKVYLALNVPFMAVLVGVMIALIVVASAWSEVVSIFLHGYGFVENERTDEIIEEGMALGEEIVGDGIVLLKNEVIDEDAGKKSLPLDSFGAGSKINVFGWASIDWVAGGYGSGFSNTLLQKMKLYEALDEADIEYNTELRKMYTDFFAQSATAYGTTWDEKRGDIEIGKNKKFRLHEPGAAYYTDEVINNAKEFSDTALVVLGRVGGEGQDLLELQTKQPQVNGSDEEMTDNSKHYLELSTEEREMIQAASEACDNVVVVLNICNAMELGFLNDPELGIDSCILVGTTGLTGVRSVIDVLSGEVNPSGRTADTFAADFTKAPSFATSTNNGVLAYTDRPAENYAYYSWYVDYTDDIYVGYRYYETAYADMEKEAAGSGDEWYAENVVYPFGYGLSYTDFEWTVKSISQESGVLAKDGKIDITVTVTNTGEVAGKDVVELYYSAPYGDETTNGSLVEKSHVVLGDFAKTGEIAPGESEDVTLTLYVQDMASYDCYDENTNEHTGYELDPGEYSLMLMRDAHNFGPMADEEKAEYVYEITGDGYNYDTDRTSGGTIENRFTGEDRDENTVPIDGSEESVNPEYMSRSDFEGTFPEREAARASDPEAITISQDDGSSEEEGLEVYEQGKGGGLTVQDVYGLDYDDEKWDALLDQMSLSDMTELITDGAFKTAEIDSIGKPMVIDFDGPTGLNTREAGDKHCRFVAYPNETLLAQTWNKQLAYDFGAKVGEEARNAGVWGWYAPSANLHRSPFGGRNYEYYSEDPLLSGLMAGYTIKGAKDEGMYCYLKHFAANENESHREGLFVWLTEQSLREIYLKPFEIALKTADGNALMTSMNRLGATWAAGSRALMTDILRGEWGFQGTAITDWVGPYMPVNLGLKAGNDLWLHRMGLTHKDASSDTYAYYARRACKNIIYTYVSTEEARVAAQGDEPVDLTVCSVKLFYGWVWIIVGIEAVMLAALGVWIFFVIKRVRKCNAEKAA